MSGVQQTGACASVRTGGLNFEAKSGGQLSLWRMRPGPINNAKCSGSPWNLSENLVLYLLISAGQAKV
jgi:hypothetical protein